MHEKGASNTGHSLAPAKVLNLHLFFGVHSKMERIHMESSVDTVFDMARFIRLCKHHLSFRTQRMAAKGSRDYCNVLLGENKGRERVGPIQVARRPFRAFTNLVDFTNARLSYVPLDLMLGFFVAGVLKRFWYLYNIIGFMENIALMTALYVRGTAERARQYRRNIVRYCQLTQVLVFRDLSMKCRKRFPTLDTVAAAGFMMPHEKENFDGIQYKYNKYFLPFNWAWALIYKARQEGLIESDYYVTVLSEEVKKFRTDLAWLCNYDWVPLPMIYPTIVCLAVHTYFLVGVIARQYVEGSAQKDEIDLVFPFMTSIQFVLYMGWLKVAEGLLNPWGEDDDDFETNVLIDRNLAMSRKLSLANFLDGFRHPSKETPMRMSSCDSSEPPVIGATAVASDSYPRMALDPSASGIMLNHHDGDTMYGASPLASGQLSRVMSDDSNGGMQMFSIAMDALEASTEMAEIELADTEDVRATLERQPSPNRDESAPPSTATEKKPSLNPCSMSLIRYSNIIFPMHRAEKSISDIHKELQAVDSTVTYHQIRVFLQKHYAR
ncbi:bestrophin-3 domain protein [Teladorsagia circumcincta]|uniref:Bestrophin homolog n=1 Tax=Teladorsagia circumcincta TaxID=45464 RepID=A0A2G9USR7_TELCI|nr:bestrophin-3 domain protein [Teladorsagia circumcincta]